MAREGKPGRKDEQLVVRIETADREWLDGLARDGESLGSVVRRLFAEARDRQLEEVAA